MTKVRIIQLSHKNFYLCGLKQKRTPKMKQLSFLFTFIMTFGICHAQDDLPAVVPDRPGYAWGAEVTPERKLIWDNGIGFESSPDGERTFTLNTTILRYGILENVELRVGTDFLLNGNGLESPHLGIAPLSFGTKIKLHEGSGWIPSVGLLAELKSPHIGSKDLLPSHIAPSIYALFEHVIGERFWICYNAGLEWDGETAAPTSFLSLAVGYNITESVGVFAETNNYLHSEEQSRHLTEFGVTWLVSRRVQLDLEADLDLRHFGKCYGFGAGVSWLIN